MPLPPGRIADRLPRKIRVLGIAPGSIVTVVQVMIKPLMLLQRQGAVEARFVYTWSCFERDLRWADVVIFCRATDRRDYSLLQRARALGKPIIYDIDDNLFHVPGDSPVARYHRDPVRQDILRAFHREADLVHVYNAELEEITRAFNPHVKRMPQTFDLGLLDGCIQNKPAHPPTIAFPTSRAGADTLGAVFAGAIDAVWREHPGSFALHVWGSAPEALAHVPGLVVEPYDPNYNTFIRRLYSSNFALGLAPLVDDVHHRCKAELKYREYGGCGIAGIYSDVPPYKHAVRHGETGLLVSNDVNAWAEALKRLVFDRSLRERIAASAREHVRQDYSLRRAAEAWLHSLRAVLSISSEKRHERPAPLHGPVPAREVRRQRLFRLARVIRPRSIIRLSRELAWLRNAIRNS